MLHFDAIIMTPQIFDSKKYEKLTFCSAMEVVFALLQVTIAPVNLSIQKQLHSWNL